MLKSRYSSFSAGQSHSDLNDIRAKLKILLDGYRKMFDQLFSNSKHLDDMLRFLPGVVVQKYMGMQGMAYLYWIRLDLLKRLINFTIEPLKPFPSHYLLDDYLSGFLQDRDRSQLYYCDPMLQHIYICRKILSLLDGSNTFDLQSSYVFRHQIWALSLSKFWRSSHDLSNYVSLHFYDHLCAATLVLYDQNISDDHPALEFLHDLETTAYYVDINSAGYICTLARFVIEAILRWANMLNCRLKVGAPSAMYYCFFPTKLPRLIWWNDECVIWQTKFIGKCYV